METKQPDTKTPIFKDLSCSRENDEIVGVVKDVSGRTFDTRYDLYFTKSRIIAAVVLHPSDLAHAYTNLRGTEQLLIGGAMCTHEIKAFAKRTKEERRRKFANSLPEEILKAHTANFEVLYRDIVSAKITKGIIGAKLQFNTSIPTKFEFGLPKDQITNVERFLNIL
jgi:hypothetical protein